MKSCAHLHEAGEGGKLGEDRGVREKEFRKKEEKERKHGRGQKCKSGSVQKLTKH